MYSAGKMLGEHWMHGYIFGGQDTSEGYKLHFPGYRGFYDRAMKFYRGGDVPRNEVRATILRYLREAEEYRNDKAAQLAQQTLAESFGGLK